MGFVFAFEAVPPKPDNALDIKAEEVVVVVVAVVDELAVEVTAELVAAVAVNERESFSYFSQESGL